MFKSRLFYQMLFFGLCVNFGFLTLLFYRIPYVRWSAIWGYSIIASFLISSFIWQYWNEQDIEAKARLKALLETEDNGFDLSGSSSLLPRWSGQQSDLPPPPTRLNAINIDVP